jgi:hypothetical protein
MKRLDTYGFMYSWLSGWSEWKKNEVWSSADIINLCSMRGSPSGYICCVQLLPEQAIVCPDMWKTCLHCEVLSNVKSNEPLSVVFDNE